MIKGTPGLGAHFLWFKKYVYGSIIVRNQRSRIVGLKIPLSTFRLCPGQAVMLRNTSGHAIRGEQYMLLKEHGASLGVKPIKAILKHTTAFAMFLKTHTLNPK